MRYQSALVLSTLAVGQAAAANHRHASFHARRSANAPGPESIEWNKVVRDAVDYDAAIKSANIPQSEWDAIWASEHGGQAAATSAPAATYAPAPAKPTTTAAAPAAPKPSDVKPSSAEKPSSAKPTSDKPSATSAAPSAKPTKPSSGGSDILEGLGCAKGANADAPNGKIWLGGEGGKVKMTVTNDADEDGAFMCWNFETMFNVRKEALIAVNVGAGSSVEISIGAGFSGGCGPAFADSKFNGANMLDETILEFTAAPAVPDMYVTGVYDISKEVNMNGIVMSATGARKCTSGLLNGVAHCLFGCKGGATTCEKTGTYGITAGADTSGMCNIGVDTYGNGGESGGCQFEPEGDHLQVTFSNSREWPSADY